MFVGTPIFLMKHGKKVMYELRPVHFAFTIICVSGKMIEKLPHDGGIFVVRKTSQREKSARIHDRYAKVQNRMRGNSLSSGPPSSARNFDGSRPANMSGDLPSKKSQLDLRPFGVGVPTMTHTVMH